MLVTLAYGNIVMLNTVTWEVVGRDSDDNASGLHAGGCKVMAIKSGAREIQMFMENLKVQWPKTPLIRKG